MSKQKRKNCSDNSKPQFEFSDGNTIVSNIEARKKEDFEDRYSAFEKKLNQLWKEKNIEQKLTTERKCVLFEIQTEDPSWYRYAERTYLKAYCAYDYQINSLKADFAKKTQQDDMPIYEFPTSFIDPIFSIEGELVEAFLEKHHFSGEVTIHAQPIKPTDFLHKIEAFFIFQPMMYTCKLWITLPQTEINI